MEMWKTAAPPMENRHSWSDEKVAGFPTAPQTWPFTHIPTAPTTANILPILSYPILIEREKREQKKKRERHPRLKPKAALPLCYGKVFKTASLSPLKSEGEAHMGKS